jgi:hypothetical protein
MGMGVAPKRKKEPGKMYHEFWWWFLIFLMTILCPNQWQFWQNMLMFVIGFWFQQTKHQELNRKGRTTIYVRKPRKKDKKEWYLFQIPETKYSSKKKGKRHTDSRVNKKDPEEIKEVRMSEKEEEEANPKGC